MDPFERLRSAGRRVTDPAEALAQAVAERVIEVVVQALDLNEIIRRIDLNEVLDQVEINHVLDRVDVDRLLDRVDVNGIVERADVDSIVQRVDVDALMGRVDVNALIDRVDVDSLIGQTDLGSIIAKSTSGFASEALDTLRSQMVMIDQYADRLVWRVERRKGERPRTPSYAPHDGGGPPARAVLPPRTAAAGRADPPRGQATAPNPARGTDLPRDPAAGSAAAAASPAGGAAVRHVPAGASPPRGPAAPAEASPAGASPATPAGASPAGLTAPPHNPAAPAAPRPPHDPVSPASIPHDPAGASPAPAGASPATPAGASAAGLTAPSGLPPGTDPARAAATPAMASSPRALVTPVADPLANQDTGGQSGQDHHAQGGGVPRNPRAPTGRGTRGTWTSLHGHYAGGASRLAAWIIDAAASTGAFTVALAAVSYAASVITGQSVSYSRSNWIVATIYGLWLFAYFAYPWALSGKSLGMAVLGIRVVAKDGTHAGWKRAVVRTLALPLSFLLLGLGLVPILLQKQNRALHDFIAGTAVVYAWDARAARIRFLARATDGQPAQPQT